MPWCWSICGIDRNKPVLTRKSKVGKSFHPKKARR